MFYPLNRLQANITYAKFNVINTKRQLFTIMFYLLNSLRANITYIKCNMIKLERKPFYNNVLQNFIKYLTIFLPVAIYNTLSIQYMHIYYLSQGYNYVLTGISIIYATDLVFAWCEN